VKLGINSYTSLWSIGFQGSNPAFPDFTARPQNPLTPLGLLQKAQELAISLVQSGPNLRLEDYPESEIENFIHTARTWEITLELGTRGLDCDHLLRQVALAKSMKAALIRTLPEINGQYSTDARLIPSAVHQIFPVLEQEVIKLAIDNGKIPAADLRAALDELHSPYVGVVPDMVNSLAVPESWKEVTRLLAPHTMCVHYKDFTSKRAWHIMGFICEGALSGKDMVDTEWLLETLKASLYDYNVIIELWPPEQPDLEKTISLEQQWAMESVSYLRKYIQD
jgi:3-oxoisoapionate decarboxylase